MRTTASESGNVSRFLLPTVLLAGLTGVWQLATSSGALADVLSLEPFLVPSPAEIADQLWESRALLADNAWVTLQEIVLGFALAVLTGLAFAVAMHFSETLRLAFYPLLVISQTIPIPAIAPILVVWFGFGAEPKLTIVALVCFFPIAVNTLDGLRSVDPEAAKMMRTLDASRLQILQRLEAPTALPQFFGGARIALAIVGIAAVFAEWSGGQSGLGILIREDGARLETARLFASIAVLSAMVIALVGLLALIERRVVDWR
jgi:NitT/TauT family transport system permease protein/putative hydroxymethylpyrimidine transport system permease protein